GVQFDFESADITHLDPGGRLFIVSDLAAFTQRYGQGLPIAGTFSGSLSNDGERLQIVDRTDNILQALTYSDADPWPSEADGEGRFLILESTGKAGPDNAAQWRSSGEGELPSDASPPPVNAITYAIWAETAFPTEVDTSPDGDPDNDGFVNLLEFASGSEPTNRRSVPSFTIVSDDELTVSLTTTQRANIMGIVFILETTNDLDTWRALDAKVISTETNITYQIPRTAVGSGSFFRIQASLTE
ncbi:MAG: hypothetical protein ACKVHP_23465, partial [Verrucomicrobiales bacterium]